MLWKSAVEAYIVSVAACLKWFSPEMEGGRKKKWKEKELLRTSTLSRVGMVTSWLAVFWLGNLTSPFSALIFSSVSNG